MMSSDMAIPVGLLFSGSSLTAAVEETQKLATLLAIEEINAEGGICGRLVAPVEVPIGPDPADYATAAEYLCDRYGVRLLFGTHMSNSRKAVLPIVEAKQALLFYSTLYEGFEFSPNCFYAGAAPNQNSVPLASHVLRHFGKRLLFVGNNYVFAHESNRIMRDLFEQAGGSILDEVYLPLDSDEKAFAAVVREAVRLAPDAIYSTVVGRDTIKLYEAFARSPLRRGPTPIVSLATNEADLRAMSDEAAEGHISAAPYFETLDTPESRAFVARYKARFGEERPVTAGAEAAYIQMKLLAHAAGACDSLQLDALVPALGEARLEAPQGPVSIDPETHHTYLWPRIARADASRRFRIIEEEGQAVRPMPYMIRHSFDDDVAQEA